MQFRVQLDGTLEDACEHLETGTGPVADITSGMDQTQIASLRAGLAGLRAALDDLQRVVDDFEEAPEPHPSLLTVSEAASALKVSRGTVYRMIDDGQIDAISVGKTKRVRSSTIDQLLRAA